MPELNAVKHTLSELPAILNIICDAGATEELAVPVSENIIDGARCLEQLGVVRIFEVRRSKKLDGHFVLLNKGTLDG